VILLAGALCGQRRTVVLDSGVARVTVDIGGGAIAGFELNGQNLNPLSWNGNGKADEPHPMGHFLCLDHWGPASAGEERSGIPFHGEAARTEWQLVTPPTPSRDSIRVEMSASLPLAGLAVSRLMELSNSAAFLRVAESVTNNNRIGRPYNMVQHPSIAPPFLDEATVVDTNARRGFMQQSPLPDPERPEVVWPQALSAGRPVDLRHLTDRDEIGVASFAIDEPYGWVTASSPSAGLLIGYIWKAAEYPWYDNWRSAPHGKPAARGLEFGTTGLHQPMPVVVKKASIFGRPLFAYLDAGEAITRTYAAFLFKIPVDYRGVRSVSYQDGRIVLRERGPGVSRDLAMGVERLWLP
jgi:hypothetical protein